MKSGISLVSQRRGSLRDKVMQVVNERMQRAILVLQKSTRGPSIMQLNFHTIHEAVLYDFK